MRPSELFRPTFRVKLLLALLGTITPLLLVTLLVVRREADRQVDIVVENRTRNAGDAFARIEHIRQQQLNQLGARLANSNRWGAALQQALEGDTAFLVAQTRYELDYAGFPGALAVFTDLGGEPLTALVNDASLPEPAVAVSKSALDRLFAGDTAIFGYHLIGRQLFSIHPIVLNLVTEPIGIVMLGFAIDDETARSLGQVINADVCFVANRQCVASSTGGPLHELETFPAAASRHVERLTIAGRQYARVARPLSGATESGIQIAMRIPLDEVVRPFTKIQRAIRYIGLLVLLIAIVTALILSRGFARPVKALVAATARVARGEYDTRVEVRTRDEIGTLAGAFNEMTHGLFLKEKYRGVLDKVVSRDVAEEMLKGEIQLGGETREVTTLFADVRNFTAMSDGMEPHEVIALLNEVMERAEAAVVAEGGVVDKYVGDEIMALFGAPVARGDDTMRAIRAAVRIQSEMAAMNEVRVPAGKPPVSLGIGINTGVVVAGNMGSARRLNYTVLGSPVNLAARLCSEAAPGQILIAQSTLEQVREHVHVERLGARGMKGMARAVEIFEVIALEESLATSLPARALLVLLAAFCLAHPATASGQRTLTLGPVQVQPSARVDLLGFVTDTAPAWLIPERSNFVAGRASGFLDIFAGRHAYGLVEVRLDRGEAPSNGNAQLRIEQAFLRLTPFTKSDVSLQAGRFVSPFGGYPQRHHSSADPLIRPPLSYDYRTMVCGDLFPFTNDGFINWKSRPGLFRPSGAPPIWAAPYQVGAMLTGSLGPVTYRLAAMNGAPSAEPRVWNVWPDHASWISWVANVGVQLTPELRVGASFDQGTYLPADANDKLPAGKTIADYRQRLIGLETTVTRGFVELRAELIHDYWQVPRVQDDPIDLSYYVESKVKIGVGAFLSGRYSGIHFNELRYSNGTTSQWDYDTRRIQFGGGYRLAEPFEVRAEVMLNHTQHADPKDNLFSIQASWILN